MPSDLRRNRGLVHLESKHSIRDTAARLQAALRKHHLRVFARINHSSEAAKAGLRLRPTLVLIFGNSALGTPMMAAAPTLGIDLPFKAMVWRDEKGKVWLTYNAPDYLGRRHHVPKKLIAKLGPLVDLLGDTVK